VTDHRPQQQRPGDRGQGGLLARVHGDEDGGGQQSDRHEEAHPQPGADPRVDQLAQVAAAAGPGDRLGDEAGEPGPVDPHATGGAQRGQRHRAGRPGVGRPQVLEQRELVRCEAGGSGVGDVDPRPARALVDADGVTSEQALEGRGQHGVAQPVPAAVAAHGVEQAAQGGVGGFRRGPGGHAGRRFEPSRPRRGAGTEQGPGPCREGDGRGHHQQGGHRRLLIVVVPGVAQRRERAGERRASIRWPPHPCRRAAHRPTLTA
jgi:hypothetical protein